MKCPKCNANNADDAKFCGDCGHKFSHKKEKVKKDITEKTQSSSKKNLWITIIVIVIGVGLLAGLLIPYKTVTRTENVPYEATEEYSVREPYSGSETYYEEVPYQDEECENKYPSFNKDQDMEWVNGMVKVICTITNFETVPVRFEYELHTTDDDNDPVDSYGPRYITIGAGQTVKKDALLTSGGRYGCSAKPDYIEECQTVTKFKNVAKERTTTNYRDVTKTRKVTKMRTDTIHTQVNWLFGVKMPWLAEWKDEGQSKWYYSLNEASE